MSDLEIAHAATMRPVTEVAEQLGIRGENVIQYGRYKAKVPLSYLRNGCFTPTY